MISTTENRKGDNLGRSRFRSILEHNKERKVNSLVKHRQSLLKFLEILRYDIKKEKCQETEYECIKSDDSDTAKIGISLLLKRTNKIYEKVKSLDS